MGESSDVVATLVVDSLPDTKERITFLSFCFVWPSSSCALREAHGSRWRLGILSTKCQESKQLRRKQLLMKRRQTLIQLCIGEFYFAWRDEEVTPLDELTERIAFIERDVNQRFDQIEQDLRDLKNEAPQARLTRDANDERFLKLCHAVDYLLEHSNPDFDTLACREMIHTLLGQRSARPFSGRTIRNRQLCKRMKRWCLFVAAILFLVAGLAVYGLHRNWCYLIVLICLLGSTLSSIGLRRIYRIIEAIW